MENNVLKFKCPHCQMALAVCRPEKALGVTVTCPKCKNQIKIKIQDKAIGMADKGYSGRKSIARLVVAEGRQRDKQSYSLHQGSNIIGRFDEDTVQDIAIEGDMTISRRSVDLTVNGNADEGFSYIFKVLNAKNMVYVNGKSLKVGESVVAHTGDTILLGNTKLLLSL